MDSEIIKARLVKPSDLRFIVTSWMESFRSSHASGVLGFREYFQQHEMKFMEILNREKVRCVVAINPQEQEEGYEIYGYLVHELGHKLPVIHWVYTKHAFRGHGVGKFLLESEKINPRHSFVYSMRTAHGLQCIRKKRLIARFDPWYAREDKHKKREEKAA